MTYHQNNGTITSSATDMPERMRLGKDFRGGWSTFAASSDSPVFVRADAQAMARCPEVAALVEAAQEALECFTPPLDLPPATLEGAIAPFTKG